MAETRIPKRVLYTNLEKEVWEANQEIDDKIRWGRMEIYMVENGGRKGIYNGEEWKKLRRAARNHRFLHMSVNESGDPCRVCNNFTKLRTGTFRLIMSVPLSVCPSAMTNLSRKACGFFENLTGILTFHCNLITITSDLHQTALHLRYQLAECLLWWENFERNFKYIFHS